MIRVLGLRFKASIGAFLLVMGYFFSYLSTRLRRLYFGPFPFGCNAVIIRLNFFKVIGVYVVSLSFTL